MKTWKEYFLAELVLWLEKLDLELVVEVVDGVEDDEVEEDLDLEEINELDRADAEQKHSELEAEHVENEKESHNPEKNFEEL